MLEVVLTIPFWFELAATITGAISGSMSASRAQYDIFGTMVMATIMGLFGGVMRDMMLQDYGIYAFQKPELIIACVVTAFIVFYFGRLVTYLDPVIDIIDSLSVGLWVVISAGKALSAGLTIVPAVILGTITAVGGGITRDVIMNRPVSAFKPGSLYGSAALIGALVFSLMKSYHILDGWSPILCVLLVVIIRFASMIFGWRTKPAHDLSAPVTDAVITPLRKLVKKDEPPSEVGAVAHRDKTLRAKRKAAERTFNKKRYRKRDRR
jgi:uncharacterized membrane protein YeiH